MSQANSTVTAESVYGGEYQVKREAREGADQLLNCTGVLLVQVPKNGRLDFNKHGNALCASASK
jgi:hypothetical protein